jgi:hypothetical protein
MEGWRTGVTATDCLLDLVAGLLVWVFISSSVDFRLRKTADCEVDRLARCGVIGTCSFSLWKVFDTKIMGSGTRTCSATLVSVLRRTADTDLTGFFLGLSFSALVGFPASTVIVCSFCEPIVVHLGLTLSPLLVSFSLLSLGTNVLDAFANGFGDLVGIVG